MSEVSANYPISARPFHGGLTPSLPHEHEVAVDGNPYELDLDTLVTENAIWKLLSVKVPVDSYNFQFDEEYGFGKGPAKRPIRLGAYYLEPGNEFQALARGVQGAYMSQLYGISTESTLESAAGYEDVSSFIFVADPTHPEDLRAAASIRVMNLLEGKSSTIAAFQAAFPSKKIPTEFEMTDIEKKRGLWDVSAVFTPDEYIVGRSSVLAYKALLKQAQSEGVSRMISVLNSDELGAALEMGMSLEIVDRTDEPEDTKQYFCVFNVNPVEPVPSEMVEAMESWTAEAENRSVAMASSAMWEKRHGLLDSNTQQIREAARGSQPDVQDKHTIKPFSLIRKSDDTFLQANLELMTFAVPTAHNVGIVAIMGEEINPELYHKARLLRANVYIDEKGFLTEEARGADGGESDIDDNRSIQFVVTESTFGMGGIVTEVVGTSRLVVKRNEADNLPVENFFSSMPTANPGSLEVSRYIARHADKNVQALASLALILGMTNEANSRGAESVYAVVERPLEVKLKWLGLPLDRMTELEYLEEYRTENAAIRFDPKTAHAGIESRRPKEYEAVHKFVGGLQTL